MKLTERNLKKFARSKLLPNADGSRPTGEKDVKELQQNNELLQRAYQAYVASDYQRRDEAKCDRYYKGYQMEDMIDDPSGCGKISEGDYIRSQGNVPIIVNMIPRLVQPVVGEFCGKQLEPFVLSRNVDKKIVGRVMTGLIKQVYESDNITETDMEGIERTAKAGLVTFRVTYERNDSKQQNEIRVRLVDNKSMLFDDPSGMYFENARLVGQIHDYELDSIFRDFADSAEDIQKIHTIYKNCQNYTHIERHFDPSEIRVDKNFYIPKNPRKCRVYELWTKEGTFSYYCHDVQEGTMYYIPMEDKAIVDMENATRLKKWILMGGDPTECPLIEFVGNDGQPTDKPIYSDIWVGNWLSPDGYVLKRQVSPYAHGEHPYVMGARLDNGEITSMVKLMLPSQRMINRLATRIEAQRTSAYKGLKIFDLDVLEASNVKPSEAAAIAAKPNGVLALRRIEGHEPLKEYKSDSSNAGDVNMMQLYMNTMADQTGVQGPFRGEAAKSSTPASLYMQETLNASNNIAPLIKWYEGLLIKRNWKIIKLIMQYFGSDKIVRVVGEDGQYVNIPFNAEDAKNADLDMYMTQSQENGPLYIANEDKLYNMAVAGMISPKVYLQNSAAPYAEKVLESMDAEQQNMQQQNVQPVMPQQQ